MKLKNTLHLVIGSLIAATSMGALAQGQGAVEVDAFAKHYFTDSSRDLSEGNLFGAGIGYYLTDDVSLGLSYGEYHDIRSENNTGRKNIKGNLASLDATYHFGNLGETVVLKHSAHTRDTFVSGALTAAAWVHKKTAGRYDMHDVLGIK